MCRLGGRINCTLSTGPPEVRRPGVDESWRETGAYGAPSRRFTTPSRLDTGYAHETLAPPSRPGRGAARRRLRAPRRRADVQRAARRRRVELPLRRGPADDAPLPRGRRGDAGHHHRHPGAGRFHAHPVPRERRRGQAAAGAADSLRDRLHQQDVHGHHPGRHGRQGRGGAGRSGAEVPPRQRARADAERAADHAAGPGDAPLRAAADAQQLRPRARRGIPTPPTTSR